MKIKLGGILDLSTVDVPGKPASVIFLWGCNFRCHFCYNIDLVIKKEYQEVETGQIVQKLEKSKPFIDAVCITGGEPTVQPEALTELCEKLKKAGFYVKLDTNGSNPKLIKDLIELKIVDFVALDVKAPLRPDIYSRVIGVSADEHVNAVRETMNILISSNIDYETRAPIVPGLNADTKILRELAEDVKNAKVFVLEQFWSGKGTIDLAFSSVKGLSREQMLKAAKFFKNKIVKIRTREAGEEVIKS